MKETFQRSEPSRQGTKELETLLESERTHAGNLEDFSSTVGNGLMPESTGIPSEFQLKPGVSVSEMEKKLIFITLNETGGNRTHAARLLGISLRTLRNKLREYRMAVECQEEGEALFMPLDGAMRDENNRLP